MDTYKSFVWQSALDYLSERVDRNTLQPYFSPVSKPKSLSEVYLRLLTSLPNKRNMSSSIGEVEKLKSVFYGFDHKKTLEAYSTWQDIFQKIKNKYKASFTADINNPHNYWVIFCKGGYSSALYLNRFPELQDFFAFVDDFDQSPNTRPALPLLIGNEIFGYGFALACDFLKEIGFSNYSKPDIHLTYIFSELGISDKTPLEVFRAVSLMAEEVGETPYVVDKIFWLIGSGDLHKHKRPFKTNRHQFVNQVKRDWASYTNIASNI